jgi:hypothetical protein
MGRQYEEFVVKSFLLSDEVRWWTEDTPSLYIYQNCHVKVFFKKLREG